MLSKYILIFAVIITGCIEEIDTANIPLEEFTTSSLLLREIEERGDYINTSASSLFSSFVTADSLYRNKDKFDIIDIRSTDKYQAGHIEGSVNISTNNLFEYFKNNSIKNSVIVSSSGQSAAYYTYLFRIYGYSNVYSLLFGIASWNKLFENEVLNNVSNMGIGTDITLHYPSKYYSLPAVPNVENKNIKDLFEERIINLFLEGFQEEIPIGVDTYQSINTINFAQLKSNLSDYYTACYGTSDLYSDPKGGIGHLPGTVLYYPYYPNSDLSSTAFLQTFPDNRKIAVYSYSGHLSAMLTAHLRLLGYDARSVLFGGLDGNYNYLKDLISAGRFYYYTGAKDFPLIIN